MKSITDNRNLFSENEVTAKKFLDDSVGGGIILRFIRTPENYLKVSVGNDVFILTKYDRIQITDTTIIKYPNTGGYLLQQWFTKCNDRNGSGKIQILIRSTKTSSPTF